MTTASPEQQDGAAKRPAGALIINADDWGYDRETTARIFECVRRRTVSSVSAMVFMEDSEDAARIALDSGIDVGLHLNLTALFSGRNCRTELLEHQQRLAPRLRRHPLARVVYYHSVAASFRYVVAAQLDEFSRLYGKPPARIDGHHHMHLCSNVLFGGLLPAGTLVRRNFSFERGEKGFLKYSFRKGVDRLLAGRHKLVDFLFSLPPLDPPGRLDKIISLAQDFVVEVETHPVNTEEYRLLTGEEILRRTAQVPIAPRFVARAAAHDARSRRPADESTR